MTSIPQDTPPVDLPAGGTVSNLSADSFTYTNDLTTALVVLGSLTDFSLDSQATSISSLSRPSACRRRQQFP